MYFQFTNREEVCIDDLSQEEINKILEESFGTEDLDNTDIPDDLWNEDGTRIQHWDEFVMLSKNYLGTFEDDALFACIDYDGSLDRFEEYYLGKFDSNAHYAQDYIESLYGLPDFLGPYVDWDRLFDDLDVIELNNYYFRCA